MMLTIDQGSESTQRGTWSAHLRAYPGTVTAQHTCLESQMLQLSILTAPAISENFKYWHYLI